MLIALMRSGDPIRSHDFVSYSTTSLEGFKNQKDLYMIFALTVLVNS